MCSRIIFLFADCDYYIAGHTTYWPENLNARDQTEDVILDKGLILRWILMKCGVNMLTGLIWLKLGSNGTQCEHSNKRTDSLWGREFPDWFSDFVFKMHSGLWRFCVVFICVSSRLLGQNLYSHDILISSPLLFSLHYHLVRPQIISPFNWASLNNMTVSIVHSHTLAI
jgi:hypothetical protein